jgi:hypothetical protein
MIRQQKHIVSFVLAVHILLSSVGIALHKRICSMPEMGTSISLFVADDEACCAKKTTKHCQKPVKKRPPVNPCCEFESDFLKTDFNTPISASLEIDFQILATIIELPFAYQPDNLLIINQLAIPLYTDTSPPLSGREILLQKHTLLI